MDFGTHMVRMGGKWWVDELRTDLISLSEVDRQMTYSNGLPQASLARSQPNRHDTVPMGRVLELWS